MSRVDAMIRRCNSTRSSKHQGSKKLMLYFAHRGRNDTDGRPNIFTLNHTCVATGLLTRTSDYKSSCEIF